MKKHGGRKRKTNLRRGNRRSKRTLPKKKKTGSNPLFSSMILGLLDPKKLTFEELGTYGWWVPEIRQAPVEGRVVFIPWFIGFQHHPNGGWEWDFWTINSRPMVRHCCGASRSSAELVFAHERVGDFRWERAKEWSDWGIQNSFIIAGQIIATGYRRLVTWNGGLVRESTPNPP